jgi:hypothetical protein
MCHGVDKSVRAGQTNTDRRNRKKERKRKKEQEWVVDGAGSDEEETVR